MKVNPSRRKFIRQLGSSSLLLAAGTLKTLAAEEKNEERIIAYTKRIGPNDKIRVACIGMGIMGNADTDSALKVPGVELVAVSDLYTGRLERAKEKYGNNVYTTRDYRELLQRKDIDAVIIATSDNWHARITIEALNSGKAVYCEKPVVQKIADGLPVIQAQQKTKKPMQVGSQRVSSIVYRKAKELYKGGAIGQLNCVEASFDRQDALGAWEYTQPTDGSATTVDWNRLQPGRARGLHLPGDPAAVADDGGFRVRARRELRGRAVARAPFVPVGADVPGREVDRPVGTQHLHVRVEVGAIVPTSCQ